MSISAQLDAADVRALVQRVLRQRHVEDHEIDRRPPAAASMHLLGRLGQRHAEAPAPLEHLAEQDRVVRIVLHHQRRASCRPPRVLRRRGAADRGSAGSRRRRPASCQSMTCGSSCGLSCTAVFGSTSSTRPCSSSRRSSSLRASGKFVSTSTGRSGPGAGQRHLAQHVVAAHLAASSDRAAAGRSRAAACAGCAGTRRRCSAISTWNVAGRQHLADERRDRRIVVGHQHAHHAIAARRPRSSSILATSTLPSIGFIRCSGRRANAVALSFSLQLAVEAGDEDQRDVARLAVAGHALRQIPPGAQIGALRRSVSA